VKASISFSVFGSMFALQYFLFLSSSLSCCSFNDKVDWSLFLSLLLWSIKSCTCFWVVFESSRCFTSSAYSSLELKNFTLGSWVCGVTTSGEISKLFIEEEWEENGLLKPWGDLSAYSIKSKKSFLSIFPSIIGLPGSFSFTYFFLCTKPLNPFTNFLLASFLSF